MSISWHGCLDRLGILHVKLLRHIFSILGLTNEGAVIAIIWTGMKWAMEQDGLKIRVVLGLVKKDKSTDYKYVP
jgi:hypothetical protein